MHLADLITALGSHLHVSGFALESNGTATLSVSEIEVTVEQFGDGDDCLIYSYLQHIPAKHEARLHRQMLHANLFGSETSDATLSLDKHTGRCLIHRKLNLASITPEEFINAWVRLVGVAVEWYERLKCNDPATPETESETDGSVPALPGQWLSV